MSTLNKKCPVNGKPINEAHTLNLGLFKLGFCSAGHRDKVKRKLTVAGAFIVGVMALVVLW